MKKNLIILSILSFAISCSKKESANSAQNTDFSERLTYDTTAIDSFAPGATPANVILNRAPIIDSADSARIAKAKLEASLLKSKKEEEDKKKAKEDDSKKKDDVKKAEETSKKKKEEPKSAKENQKPAETDKKDEKPSESK